MTRGPRRGKRQGRKLPGVRAGAIVITLLGMLGATLALSHAAAQTGVMIEAFRPLGGSFFAWRAGHAQLFAQIGPQAENAGALPLAETGRETLKHSPLTARAVWLIGLDEEAGGDMEAARRAMGRAEKITRREGAVQLWLGNDALRRGDAAAGLAHYDMLMRTNPRTTREMMPRLASVLAFPEGRAALVPYIRADNGWMPGLMMTAVQRLPQAAPLAQLLLDTGRPAPDVAAARPAYAALIARLAEQRSYKLLARVYPLLPEAQAVVLRGVEPESDSGRQVYPPADWDFGRSSDRGASAITLSDGGSGVEYFAAPGTTGVAASKLVMPGTNRLLRWRVVDRSPNPRATAYWTATCVTEAGDGESVRSSDLFAQGLGDGLLQMRLPGGCSMLRLDMRIAGGLGQDTSRLTIGSLALASSAAAPAR